MLWYLMLGVCVAWVVTPALGQNPRPETSSQAQKTFVLGQHLGQELEHQDGSIDDSLVLGYVQELENRIATVTGSKSVAVRITRGSKSYAQILPHGVLYVSAALYERTENEAELAGLLAHQLSHIKQTNPTSIPVLMPTCVLSSDNLPIRWSVDRRESERVATESSIQVLRAGGYDPAAVVDLFSKLAYEHPVWRRAIVPGDLLGLRIVMETNPIPEAGYKTNTSQFVQAHARVAEALALNAKARSVPTLRVSPH